MDVCVRQMKEENGRVSFCVHLSLFLRYLASLLENDSATLGFNSNIHLHVSRDVFGVC